MFNYYRENERRERWTHRETKDIPQNLMWYCKVVAAMKSSGRIFRKQTTINVVLIKKTGYRCYH